MERIEKLSDFTYLKGLKLYQYLNNKAKSMLTEYNVNSLENIGCFVVLEQSELDYLMNKMLEFVEVITVEDETYLHTVWLINDNFGEDIYIEILGGVVNADT